MYSPADIEKTIYSHLVTIYALLISALISLGQTNLTRNDAVFVLVSVASPATLYLWIVFLVAAFYRRLSPWKLAAGIDKIPQVFLFFTIVGSLVMWITMLVIIAVSPSSLSFIQPACSKEYGAKSFLKLIWLQPYLSQFSLLILAFNVVVMGPLAFAEDNGTVLTLKPNLLHWTRESLILLWPSKMKNRQRTSFVLYLLQISMSAPLLRRTYVHYAIAGALRLFCLFRHRQNTNSLSPHSNRERRSIKDKITSFTFIELPFYSLGICLSIFVPQLPGLDAILLLAVLVPVWCVNAPRIYHSKRQILLSRGLFICSTPAAIIARYFLSISGISFAFFWWAVPWVHATSVKTRSPYALLEKQREFWYKLSDCGAFLKFLFLIIGPTISWMRALTFTGSSLTSFSSALTFGQLLSIFSSVLPAWTLLSLVFKKVDNIMDTIMVREYEQDIQLPVIPMTKPVTPRATEANENSRAIDENSRSLEENSRPIRRWTAP